MAEEQNLVREASSDRLSDLEFIDKALDVAAGAFLFLSQTIQSTSGASLASQRLTYPPSRRSPPSDRSSPAHSRPEQSPPNPFAPPQNTAIESPAQILPSKQFSPVQPSPETPSTQQSLSSLLLEPFQYEPLDHTTDSIRLVEVLPNDDEYSIMRCTMRHARISGDEYKCLSYTWLPELPQHVIEVNGCALTVGENLYQFLLAYRTHQKNGTFHGCPCHGYAPLPTMIRLWTDALYINQQDVIEQSYQVEQMGLIYQNANQIWIWMGKLGAYIKRLFDAVDAIGHDIVHAFGPSSRKQIMTIHYNKAVPKLLAKLSVDDRTSVRDCLLAMIKLRYRTRTWVIKQILLAKDNPEQHFGKVGICLGSRLTDFLLMHAWINSLRTYDAFNVKPKDIESDMYIFYDCWRQPGCEILTWCFKVITSITPPLSIQPLPRQTRPNVCFDLCGR